MTQQQTLKNPQLEIGDYFDIGWSIFKDNLSNFLVLVLVIDIPIAILQLLSPTPEDPSQIDVAASPVVLVVGIVSIVLSLVGVLSAFILTESAVLNRPIEMSAIIQQGFSRFLPSLLVIIVGGILTLIGFLLLIVPGIYLGNLFYFSFDAVALRGCGLDGLSYSRNLVKGQWWKIFGRAFLLSFAFLILFLILAFGLGFASIVVSAIPLLPELMELASAFVLGLVSYLFLAILTVFFLNVDYVRNATP
ncbi:hypothetical protein E1H12_01150 [Geitlerinema sp. P-1104]|uniref:hypothetical protein n=1 Tax=Geitlerinema sp. P-1104 TaxID=2546230 RepID=UPI001476A953|nr:hypothetical protein [Geitlerinema sp. P-1104]NMG57159.1 hypothetical protein [Geitlerinema sp. P-1104]